jgi:hypothetical protein
VFWSIAPFCVIAGSRDRNDSLFSESWIVRNSKQTCTCGSHRTDCVIPLSDRVTQFYLRDDFENSALSAPSNNKMYDLKLSRRLSSIKSTRTTSCVSSGQEPNFRRRFPPPSSGKYENIFLNGERAYNKLLTLLYPTYFSCYIQSTCHLYLYLSISLSVCLYVNVCLYLSFALSPLTYTRPQL